MKNLKSIPIVIAVLIHASAAIAGEGSGVRGGDIVICDHDGKKVVDLLDYYEASTDPRLKPALPGNTWQKKVAAFIERAGRRDRVLHSLLSDYFSTWDVDAVITDRVQIPDIDDSTPAYRWKGCRIKQAAYQRMNARTLEVRYLIDREIWNTLDLTQQAGLVIHELLYRFAFTLFKASNSDGIRYFNGIMSSGLGADISTEIYARVMEDSSLGDRIDAPGYTFMYPEGSRRSVGSVEEMERVENPLVFLWDKGVLFRAQIRGYITHAEGLQSLYFEGPPVPVDPNENARIPCNLWLVVNAEGEIVSC